MGSASRRPIWRRARTERRLMKIKGKGWKTVLVVTLGGWKKWRAATPSATASVAYSRSRRVFAFTAMSCAGSLGHRPEIHDVWRRVST
jgi:hypothetical protein